MVADGFVVAKSAGRSTVRSKRSHWADAGHGPDTGSETSEGPDVKLSAGVSSDSVPLAGSAAWATNPAAEQTNKTREASARDGVTLSMANPGEVFRTALLSTKSPQTTTRQSVDLFSQF